MQKLIKIITAMTIASTLLVGCGTKSATPDSAEQSKSTLITISAEEAKNIMDTEEDVVILDVRTAEEHAEGYIKDSIVVPLEDIETDIEATVPDKDTKILVYCRSGKRSAQSLKTFEKLGYTNVFDFGGINDWTYGIEK